MSPNIDNIRNIDNICTPYSEQNSATGSANLKDGVNLNYSERVVYNKIDFDSHHLADSNSIEEPYDHHIKNIQNSVKDSAVSPNIDNIRNIDNISRADSEQNPATGSANVKDRVDSNYSEGVVYNNIDIDSHNFADSNSNEEVYDHIKNIQQLVKDSAVSPSLDNIRNIDTIASGGFAVRTSSNVTLLASDQSEEPINIDEVVPDVPDHVSPCSDISVNVGREEDTSNYTDSNVIYGSIEEIQSSHGMRIDEDDCESCNSDIVAINARDKNHHRNSVGTVGDDHVFHCSDSVVSYTDETEVHTRNSMMSEGGDEYFQHSYRVETNARDNGQYSNSVIGVGDDCKFQDIDSMTVLDGENKNIENQTQRTTDPVTDAEHQCIPEMSDDTGCSANQLDKNRFEDYGEEEELVNDKVSVTGSAIVKDGVDSNYSERVVYNKIDFDSHHLADSNSIEEAYDHIENIQKSVKDSAVSPNIDNIRNIDNICTPYSEQNSATGSANVKDGVNSNYSEIVVYNNVEIDSHHFADSNSIEEVYDHIKNIQKSVKDSAVSPNIDNIRNVDNISRADSEQNPVTGSANVKDRVDSNYSDGVVL